MSAPEPMRGSGLYPAQWQLACAVLDEVLQGRAADRCLQAAFRERRNMGGRDRAWVTEMVYGVLRDLRRLRAMVGEGSSAALCAALLLRSERVSPERLQSLGVDVDALRARLAAHDDSALTAAERANVPDTIYQAWQLQYGDAAESLAAALCEQAPVDLRVNTLKCDRAEAQAALSEAGIEVQVTPYAPQGLRVARRAALQNLAIYRDGWIEPQDEGSQLLAMLMDAQPGETVIDYCAGAGGKTLALAAQMQDRGTLYAWDSDSTRLARLAPRLQRAGVHCVQIRTLGNDEEPEVQADAVLVDAPCSATGTWRRQPEARLKALDLPSLTTLQAQILARAARHVRPGGRLVYATCSLLDAENADIVEAFLAAHPQFELDDAGAELASAGITLPGRMLQLLPHQHGTDGFFAARLRRRMG
ncbi:RsmB/NOP family class I SAM-dependent RNA methyltransferase [Sinimarinibacterium sp. CAU 1509]|uniref:RsmB/NOP family class I SAM-dependent RNA methyltransferase n=1 Tax=Sinimarinibacterium sp. CAU 1509 TaxID=2562283 RepID=UPI0010ABDF70|nr:RsmB/NOP family class I SAM-dependent RNA methyltransferase [Sinimarinibacterium sp. CAU 1509]TJY63124.1 RsmB/NOP family class I SAM-dependent RNA methyltransferase [Sinimarinibacterium sp. CAU 1509]